MAITWNYLQVASNGNAAVKPASEMTDEELEARIRELDVQVRPLIEMRPVES